MISYDAFINITAGRILNYLPQEEYKGADVQRVTNIKNNGQKCSGIYVRKAGSDMAPTMYMDRYYDEYRNGKPLEDVLREAAMDYEVVDQMPPQFSRGRVTDWEEAREHIFPKLVGVEHNGEYLRDKVYVPASDMAEIFQIRVADLPGGTVGFVAVTENIQRLLGVGTDEMQEAALTNMRIHEPASLRSLNEVMEGLMGMSVPGMDTGIYVLTNASSMNGASVILDPNVAQAARETIGDYYILPSSIHELLLVPKSETGMDVHELEQMVMEVNLTTVEPQERLSDHVYEIGPDGFSLVRAMGEEKTEELEAPENAAEEKSPENNILLQKQEEKADVPKPKGMSL